MKIKQQVYNKSMDEFIYITMKRRHRSLDMCMWTKLLLGRRTTSSIILIMLINVILLPLMVNGELSDKKRPFQTSFELQSAENRYVRASSNPLLNRKERPVLFPRPKTKQNSQKLGDKSTSHVIKFPTSSKQSLQNIKKSVSNKRSSKQNAVKITQNYSVLNIFNATHPMMKDSSKLKDTELIEYLNYLHQLPPKDAAEAQQPQKINSHGNQENNETIQSQLLDHFNIKKDISTTESPIETLNKLRQKVFVKTTSKPLFNRLQGNPGGSNSARNIAPQPRHKILVDTTTKPSFDNNGTDLNQKHKSNILHHEEPQPITESPLEILDKIRQKLSPLLTTYAPESKPSTIVSTTDAVEVTTLSSFKKNNQPNKLLQETSNNNVLSSDKDSLLNATTKEEISMLSQPIGNDANGHGSKEYATLQVTTSGVDNNNTTYKYITKPMQTTTQKSISFNLEDVEPSHTQFHSPVTKSLDTTSSIHSMEISKNTKKKTIDDTNDVSMIPILPAKNQNMDSKFTSSNTMNATAKGDLNQPSTKENKEKEITNNTSNILHSFESIEVGVVVGVAIGVFIVFICFGSLMLCFRCGQRRGRRKESNLNTITGDCGNVGCSGQSLFGGKRNVYNTNEHANGEPGSGENQLGYTSIYPTSGYFRQHGPPIMLTNELIMNYDETSSESFGSFRGSQQSIELSCSYSNPIDLNKRSKSDKVTEL